MRTPTFHSGRRVCCDEVTSHQVLSNSLLAVLALLLVHRSPPCERNRRHVAPDRGNTNLRTAGQNPPINFLSRVIRNCLCIFCHVCIDSVARGCVGQQLTWTFPFGTARAAPSPPFPRAGNGSWYSSALYHFICLLIHTAPLLRPGTSVNKSG